MRRKIEYIDKSRINSIKNIRNDIYGKVGNNETLIINDNNSNENIAKQISNNSIVINKGASNR